MDIWNNYITELRNLFDLYHESEIKLNFLKQLKSNTCSQYEMTINSTLESIEEKLRELVKYPPHHLKHFDKLHEFYKDDKTNYNKCVFIMTKYCENNSRKDKELQKIIDTVCQIITDIGYIPKLPNRYNYHSSIWDNTEICMLGSSKGVAIVEDKYKPELNPNVAMEWGWMKGMGRNILFLMEKSFKHLRADWEGMRRETFSWDNPEAGIRNAIVNWLSSPIPDKGRGFSNLPTDPCEHV